MPLIHIAIDFVSPWSLVGILVNGHHTVRKFLRLHTQKSIKVLNELLPFCSAKHMFVNYCNKGFQVYCNYTITVYPYVINTYLVDWHGIITYNIRQMVKWKVYNLVKTISRRVTWNEECYCCYEVT